MRHLNLLDVVVPLVGVVGDGDDYEHNGGAYENVERGDEDEVPDRLNGGVGKGNENLVLAFYGDVCDVSDNDYFEDVFYGFYDGAHRKEAFDSAQRIDFGELGDDGLECEEQPYLYEVSDEPGNEDSAEDREHELYGEHNGVPRELHQLAEAHLVFGKHANAEAQESRELLHHPRAGYPQHKDGSEKHKHRVYVGALGHVPLFAGVLPLLWGWGLTLFLR